MNWTSSFRTPASTLKFWRERFDLPEMVVEWLAPWFEQVEQRLSIGPWVVPPNANNERLRRRAESQDIAVSPIQRNVKACWNLGSCGMGRPVHAKQSMLVTTLPAALDRGAKLLAPTRVERRLVAAGKVTGLVCMPVALNGRALGGPGTQVQARRRVVAAGAINSPPLLLPSKAPDPHGRLGRRTFLHTVLASTTVPGFDARQSQALKAFAHTQALLALLRDGFHEQSPGGSLGPRGDGSPVLDYPLTDSVFEGARRALLSMVEIQFAAGARTVTPGRVQAVPYRRGDEARSAILALPMKPYLTSVVSANVMGGCGLAGQSELGVMRPDGRHRQPGNLSVHDGSLFPASIGANPQLSVYGLANKLATQLAKSLSGRDVRLA